MPDRLFCLSLRSSHLISSDPQYSIMSSGPITYLPEHSEELCQRCNDQTAVLVARKEKFCLKCFVFFMKGKQRKLMLDERYKVKYGAIAEKLGVQKVLLPLSYGASSLVLLDMVASLLQEQNLAHKGKQGFELVVLHIKEPGETKKSGNPVNITPGVFQSLSSVYSPVKIAYHEIDLRNSIPKAVMNIAVDHDFGVIASEAQTTNNKTMEDLLLLCGSRSLQEDLLSLLKSELIKKFAMKSDCQTILYGHSMTRIANEVIALTVKGRGLTIHESVTNRVINYDGNDIQVIYPLREILKAEVHAILLFNDHLQKYFVPEAEAGSRLAKNKTVRDLTTQYFDNLDATGYASTASTVVKTAEKLGESKEPEIGHCEVCGSTIHHQPKKWLKDITVTTPAKLVTVEELEYAREFGETEGPLMGRELVTCYGCTVTLAGSGKGFVWPMRASEKEIIDEYVLTDDEEDEL